MPSESSPQPGGSPDAILLFARWAGGLAHSAPDCAAVHRLAGAIERLNKAEEEHVRLLLERSSLCFAPLRGPIDALDFSGHGWLGKQREEAWSDWLAWIISTLRPSEIWDAFGVSDAETIRACTGERVTVTREETVPKGHAGCQGRLDVVVRFGEVALLVIEVKLVEAEEADSAKQEGYSRWVADQPRHRDRKHKVMLVRAAAGEDYRGFHPRRWTELCLALRGIAVRYIGAERTFMAAVILTFVGAVEQNLLGLRRQLRLSNTPIADHIEKFLAKECPHA